MFQEEDADREKLRIACAGGPVVIEEEGQPDVVAGLPRFGWIIPLFVGLIILCAIACGDDDPQTVDDDDN